MSIPNRASDAGPQTTTCPNCGETYEFSHDCRAEYDWVDWLYEAESLIRHATRADEKRQRLQYIEAIEQVVKNAKVMLMECNYVRNR